MISGEPLAQLVKCRALDSEAAGSNLHQERGIVSLSKTLRLHCIVIVQPTKTSQHMKFCLLGCKTSSQTKTKTKQNKTTKDMIKSEVIHTL